MRTWTLLAALAAAVPAAAMDPEPVAQTGPMPGPERERGAPGLEFGWKDGAVLAFNAGASCLISGIGAATKNKNFLEGCAKGAFIAAPIIYAGQKAGIYTGYYPGLGYAATTVHSLGVSMRDNVADGLGLLDRYQVNVGPVQLSFGKDTPDGPSESKAYFLPLPLGGMLYGMIDGKMDLERTMLNGVPSYKGNLSIVDKLNRGHLGGVTLPNIIVMGDGGDSTYGHEFIHTLQYREMSFLDLVFDNYAWGESLQKGYVKVGMDAGMLALQPPGLLLPHDSRPVELVPVALELKDP